ncbi:NADPH dehydrogenase [Limosilactobacillus equigenerosi]|uniref:NADPH dehydrogenase n=1 Tax=Limosilactobacillus equigenerosi DSM 18793 = JCM 14505 TaxID=1423742 RepID=A0A0R1UW43_9LACO|nr:NADPH dehydrogenase [Limosilactobacillus equigenerosi]KRL95651.1 NADPH dehydrogenase [Limosilactobacillus equigenerosi DSM 18793 = JCM 14505]
MAKLLTPVTLGGVTLKNRVVMPPMCMYDVAKEDGLPTAFHHAHYGARAIGGVGLIIQEATAVDPVGRLTSHDLGIWNDEQAQALTGLVAEVHALGAKMGIQLGHGGRKAADEAQPVAPSAVPYDEQGTFATPHELSLDEIKATVQSFADAAKRADQAGYDVIQLHAAHGYLINQFLEPTTNLRTDSYGGSLAKRFEFLKEIVIAIQAVTSLPIWVRLSVTAYADHQNSIADYQQIAQWCGTPRCKSH